MYFIFPLFLYLNLEDLISLTNFGVVIDRTKVS